MNLNINGVPEDEEYSPGGLVSLNDDDDNNNGIEDKDEAPVNGEDDLVAIYLSIWPSNLNTGEMELRVVSATSIKIWSSPDKQGLIIPTGDPLDWSKKWPVQQLPPTLYVEGTSSTLASSVVLQLSYFVDVQMCIHSVLVRFTVVKVNIDAGLNEIDEVNPGKYINVNWDDANADGTKDDLDPNCQHFHNCMECKGDVKPSGVTNEVDFDIKRDRWLKTWTILEQGDWQIDDDDTPWKPDDSTNDDEDLSPSVTNHIYSIDGPGYIGKLRTATYDCLAYIGDFREWVMVKIDGSWYQCSNYYKWHAKTITEPKNDIEMTRASMDLQLSGGGWIVVPDSP